MCVCVWCLRWFGFCSWDSNTQDAQVNKILSILNLKQTVSIRLHVQKLKKKTILLSWGLFELTEA